LPEALATPSRRVAVEETVKAFWGRHAVASRKQARPMGMQVRLKMTFFAKHMCTYIFLIRGDVNPFRRCVPLTNR